MKVIMMVTKDGKDHCYSSKRAKDEDEVGDWKRTNSHCWQTKTCPKLSTDDTVSTEALLSSSSGSFVVSGSNCCCKVWAEQTPKVQAGLPACLPPHMCWWWPHTSPLTHKGKNTEKKREEEKKGNRERKGSRCVRQQQPTSSDLPSKHTDGDRDADTLPAGHSHG